MQQPVADFIGSAVANSPAGARVVSDFTLLYAFVHVELGQLGGGVWAVVPDVDAGAVRVFAGSTMRVGPAT
ncbi:hypothetical protein [Streptomyces sp. NBC_00572]|uniref:hypothetical protein n=1 Tax=Streptomyces sp. NBC_00572 TaxID=2903664 RepID=UPI00224DAA6E|nr:hypothetical protein [Streptomyces sp. NBC_00572]MCX4986071.1 hypothetical protein [Streptomyces sp. NBC_00572]